MVEQKAVLKVVWMAAQTVGLREDQSAGLSAALKVVQKALSTVDKWAADWADLTAGQMDVQSVEHLAAQMVE